MKKFTLALSIAISTLALGWTASAQLDPANSSGEQAAQKNKQPISPEEIIKQFTTRESELREVWKEYSYQQETKLQVLGQADTISGEFYQVSEFVFNDAGKRIERILKAPPSTLDQAGLIMTGEDRDALINLQPFALSKEDLPNYIVSYVGKEKIDELNCYVFDVIPKVMASQRELDRMRKAKIEGKFFQGKIWVDDEDLQIVKTAGKTVPEFKQRFPKFETYRENIGGRYWFPTYTFGKDVLEFDRFRVPVRLMVKYKNYRQFQSDVKLVDVEEVKGEAAKPSQSEDKAKPGDVKPEAKKEEPKKDDGKAKPPRPRP